MNCPNCGLEADDEGPFCAGCGTKLTPPQEDGPRSIDPKKECPGCHAGPGCIDATTGFCTNCGTRRLPDPRDHFTEVISSKAAGVSDIGLSHKENQDFMAIGTADGALALIVCDGVSNSQHSMAGSKAAAQAARDRIIAEFNKAGAKDPDLVLKQAILDAQESICQIPFTPLASETDLPPAQCTIVGAVIVKSRVTFSWVGDSRIYFATRKKATQLTVDHSWYNYAIAPKPEGLGYTPEQAAHDHLSHALFKSLGADNDGKNAGIEPDARALNLSEPGILLLVTDGFWNYLDDEKHLVSLINQLPEDTDALSLANHLVNFANFKGGHDNITVVAVKV